MHETKQKYIIHLHLVMHLVAFISISVKTEYFH